MISAFRTFTDRLLGRGDATITVPSFDGALKPNQILERAETIGQFEAPEDLATDGNVLYIADGAAGRRASTLPAPRRRSGGSIAPSRRCLPGGGMAVALEARGADVCDPLNAGRCHNLRRRLDEGDQRAFARRRRNAGRDRWFDGAAVITMGARFDGAAAPDAFCALDIASGNVRTIAQGCITPSGPAPPMIPSSSARVGNTAWSPIAPDGSRRPVLGAICRSILRASPRRFRRLLAHGLHRPHAARRIRAARGECVPAPDDGGN